MKVDGLARRRGLVHFTSIYYYSRIKGGRGRRRRPTRSYSTTPSWISTLIQRTCARWRLQHPRCALVAAAPRARRPASTTPSRTSTRRSRGRGRRSLMNVRYYSRFFRRFETFWDVLRCIAPLFSRELQTCIKQSCQFASYKSRQVQTCLKQSCQFASYKTRQVQSRPWLA